MLDLVLNAKMAASHSSRGLTYSAACAGFKIACNGWIVDPSEISAKAKRFCLRTDRMNPLTLISWSSKLQGWPCLLLWRICAHRRIAGRELGVVLEPSLATDVAKVRRHVCMAGMVLRWCWKGDLIDRRLRAGKMTGQQGGSASQLRSSRLTMWTRELP